MAKYPKFLIAKNPMADPDGVYIFHTQKPRFLAKNVGVLIEVIDDIDDMLHYYGNNTEKVSGLLKRTNEWYKAFKIHNRDETV